MKQLARGSLIVMLLLASLGTASAECAWVLWIKHEDLHLRKAEASLPEASTRWELQKAHPNHAGCDGHKERLWRFLADQYADLSKFPGVEKVHRVPYEAVSVTLKESEWLRRGHRSQFLHCLPDTIDPRGPKGGGR